MATAKKKQEENADNIDLMDGDSDIEDDTDYKDFSDSFKEFKENNNEAGLCSSSSSNLSQGMHDTAMLASEAGMGCVNNIPPSSYGNSNAMTPSNDVLSAHVQRMTSHNTGMSHNMADMYMSGANHNHLLSTHIGGLHAAQ